jgi:hypothetical protein
MKQMLDPAPMPGVIAVMLTAIMIGLVVAWAIVKGPLHAF